MVVNSPFRIPPQYLGGDTLSDRQATSSLVALQFESPSSEVPQLSEVARDKLVYANLTLGALVDGRARIDFNTLPNFTEEACAAVREARTSLAGGAADLEVLQVFGNEMGVPTKYGPEIWKAVMEKVVRKIENITTWKHQRGLSIAKSLDAAVRAMWPVKRVQLQVESTPRAGRDTRSPSTSRSSLRELLDSSDSDSEASSNGQSPSLSFSFSFAH